MKKIVFLFIISIVSLSASAQINFYKLSVGLNGGINRYIGDITYEPKFKPTIALTGDFNITPFSSVGLEIQKGTLSAGDSIKDPHQRYFKNSYTTIIIGGKVGLGQVVNTDNNKFLTAVKGFYLGTGVGFMMNNMKEINRYTDNGEGGQYKFPGKDKATNLLIPANIGFNFPFQDHWGYTRVTLNVNYQFNYSLGEDMDGYDDPPSKFENHYYDTYHNFTVGVKYSFGPEGIF
ncbi:hypothetical protein GS399_02835 [Pedobacter sp. HMF7647]|uniref:Outer membrane beta-barrel protein n=1 Tax=Hufsiella arboris TaxID=2695275 RepID=A0A7K1Y5M8_9SPHI|nr:hypothetical protein [Hufsiella arboris]MXV49892.1 hypothetical protein [Hufsiella arboris]